MPVASVTVSPTAAEIIAGKGVQLQATALDSEGGTLTDREVSWSSSAETVARVDRNGRVTGQVPGSVTISATSESRVGTAAITVTAPPDPCQPEGARSATIGATTTGFLAATDCLLGDGSYFDLYRFQLMTPGSILIDLRSNDFDAFLFLLQGNVLVAYDDDSGENENARIVNALAAGTYIVLATSWGRGETGAYHLDLSSSSAAGAAAALDADLDGVSGTAKPGAAAKRFRPIR